MGRRPIARGAYCFAEDPQHPAHDADVFWDTRCDPTVIVATAQAAEPDDAVAFDLFGQRVPATILRCPERSEELRLALDGRAIRLSVASGTLLDGPVRLTYRLDGDRCLAVRLRALRAFDDFLRLGHIPLPSIPSASGPRRMTMLLTTMDGLARGWSQRQIAIALFGQTIVTADWDRPSDFLRSRVRRLIAWAEELSGDAYLDLLQR